MEHVYYCRHCKKETPHNHRRTPTHPNLPETHVVGSECFRCELCKKYTYAISPEASRFPFELDQIPLPAPVPR